MDLDPSTFRPPISLGDKPLSPSQLHQKLAKALDRVVPTLTREMLITTQFPVAEQIGSAGALVQSVSGAINQFNISLIALTAAQARLSQYRKADGRPEITEEQPSGEFDTETGEPIMETVVIQSAIEPLPPTIEQPAYDDMGEPLDPVTVDNPAIVQDDAERAEAQAVIDSTPDDVKAFADL